MLKLNPVVGSSQVAADAYDAEQRHLIVEFKTDPVPYIYLDVPPDVAMAYAVSPSKGSFLAKFIKGKYDYKRPDAEQSTTTP